MLMPCKKKAVNRTADLESNVSAMLNVEHAEYVVSVLTAFCDTVNSAYS